MYGPQITLLPMVAKGDNPEARIAVIGAAWVVVASNSAEIVLDITACIVDVRLLTACGIVNEYNVTG